MIDIDYLLTATPSARKSLDLDVPVDLREIRECLRIGLQAANGSNAQSWRWLVVTDAALRATIADLYREAYLLRVGGQLLADLMLRRNAGELHHAVDGVAGREHGPRKKGGHCWSFPAISHTRRASRVMSRFIRPRCTARSSRRYGTFSWRCIPGDTGRASRPCTCIAKRRSGGCSEFRKTMSRVVCYPWAASVPGAHSGRLAGGRSTR